MAYAIKHAQIGGSKPFWYHLEFSKDLDAATRRARQYGLDNGGYVCVADLSGKTVFGTDPASLDRAIALGVNKYFSEPAIAA